MIKKLVRQLSLELDQDKQRERRMRPSGTHR